MIRFIKENKDYIFIFFITLLFAYIIGLTIVSIVNKRLTDISINIPAPQVTVQWPKDMVIPATSTSANTVNSATIKSPTNIYEGFTPGSEAPINCPLRDDDLRGFIGQKEYADCTEATSQVVEEKLQQMNRVCIMNHNHNKYLCQYGQTNYLNPMELDPINRRLYQYNYFQNMTLQDYINWLWLYEKEPEKLCYEHNRNLKKLLDDTGLIYQPGICPPKLNSEGSVSYSDGKDLGKYFQEIMKNVQLTRS